MAGLDLVKQRLQRFAVEEAAESSPLYDLLATRAAADDDVAALLTPAPDQFAYATLLFAAAQRLVQAEPWIELANYYLTMGGSYGPDEQVWTLFREFVLERAEKMRELTATRTTQTNEVRRAATLFPAVALAAKEARGPVGLLEVGTSAGLLLGMDRYGFRYQTPEGDQVNAGPTKTPLVLTCDADGRPLPRLPKKLVVSAKVGLDRNPVDLTDEDELAWLEACVWADQPERSRRLRVAAEMQRKDPPTLVSGDAVDALTKAASQVPAESPLVVLNSHSLSYLPEERRPDYVAALAALAETRPVWWASQEAYLAAMTYLVPGRADFEDDPKRFRGVLGLVRWESGKPDVRLLGRTGPHGRTLTWL